MTAENQPIGGYGKGLDARAKQLRIERQNAAELETEGEQQQAFDLLGRLHAESTEPLSTEQRRELIAAAADRAALVAEDAVHSARFFERCEAAVGEALALLDEAAAPETGTPDAQAPEPAEDPVSRFHAARALDQWSRLLLHRSTTSEIDARGDGRQGASDTFQLDTREVTAGDRPYIDAARQLIERFGADELPATRRIVAVALKHLTSFHRQRLHLDEAQACGEEFQARFGQDPAGELLQPGDLADDQRTILHHWTARTLDLGYLHFKLREETEQAIGCYRRLIARIEAVRRSDESAGLRDLDLEETLAMATASLHSCLSVHERRGGTVDWQLPESELVPQERRDAVLDRVNAGVDLADAGDHTAALALWDAVLAEYAASRYPMMRMICMDASMRKAQSLRRLGRLDDALETVRETRERFGQDLSITVQKDLAGLLSGAATCLDLLERREDELAVYREIIERWQGYGRLDILRLRVAEAQRNSGITLEDLGRTEEAETAYWECRWAMFDEQDDVRQQGADAMLNLGVLLWRQDRLGEALQVLERLETNLAGESAIGFRTTLWLACACIARCKREQWEHRQHRQQSQQSQQGQQSQQSQQGAAEDAYGRYRALLRDPDGVFAAREKMAANLRAEFAQLQQSVSLLTRLRWWWRFRMNTLNSSPNPMLRKESNNGTHTR